jgi:DNA-binding NarL/FixJ family response regulator
VPSTVILVEDAPEMRAMLRAAVRLRLQMDVVGEAETSEAAGRLAFRLHPDLVVLDPGLQDTEGRESFARVHEASPESGVVVYSGADSDRHWYEKQGVRFVLKGGDLTALLDAITATTADDR